jgi:hypothetical protein
MNEMELLQKLAQETPLPAPAELDAARARLLAAIGTDPAAGRATSVAAAAKSESHPSSDQPAGPLRPAAPAPVHSAVRLMWGGAVGTAVQLIIALFYLGDIKAYHLTVLGHHLSTAQLVHWRPLIVTLAITLGLVEIALWLWTARALQLGGSHGAADLFFAVLTWLTGLAAVWQLWRPAATAFFKPRALD